MNPPLSRSILLTGITGTACGRLAVEMLCSGVRLHALMRARDLAAAGRRLEAVFCTYSVPSLLDKVNLLLGDVTSSGFGLADLPEPISMIVHGAACVAFSAARDQELFRVNVLGTRHALDLATRLQVPLVFISTAYVAGNRQGVVHEHELDQGQGFNNAYEQSKAEAEGLVRR